MPGPAALMALTFAISGVATNPQEAGAAYLTNKTTVVYQSDAGRVRQFRVPEGCVPSGLTKGAVGLSCGGRSGGVGILSLSSGRVRAVRLDLHDRHGYTLLRMGRRWLDVRAWQSLDAPGGHVTSSEVLVSRSTGHVIDLAKDPFGQRRAIDLDRRSGSAPLCHSLRRHLNRDPLARERFAPMYRVGRRVFDPSVPVLVNCRTARRRALPMQVSLAYAGPLGQILGRRFVVLPDALIGLATGRRQPLPSGGVLSAGALWLRDGAGSVKRVAI